MTSLVSSSCEACQVGAPLLSQEQLNELLPSIPEWLLVNELGVNQLCRSYDFDNFAEALAFTNLVADLAEQEGHHPALLLEWGRVTVRWWTHKIKGLHRNDAVMAAKTDLLFQRRAS
ncbi:4a-hydroxytetrahydrobiopterin dehydratase [Agaribacterium sp. ZY112]|uniref:4a-hydroxytetrahydrobiopterin dehydratase n=1 Tax=Agaribacterium sp. ZY112 TaxID=3233574 RepID=UPI0035263B9F